MAPYAAKDKLGNPIVVATKEELESARVLVFQPGLPPDEWLEIAKEAYQSYWVTYLGPQPFDPFESLPEYIQTSWVNAAKKSISIYIRKKGHERL